MKKEIGKYLVIDPEICHGNLTFKGTRIFVSSVIEQVSKGENLDSIVKEWSGKVSKDAIIEALSLYVRMIYKSNSNKIDRLMINNILIDSGMTTKEKLESLANEGKIRLPLKKGKIPTIKSIKLKGKMLSEIIIENRK